MKSILIIDTPKTCKECRCQMMLVCVPADEDIDEYVDPNTTIPNWCPLKSLPQKKNTDFHPNVVYANGWNDCLEELKK